METSIDEPRVLLIGCFDDHPSLLYCFKSLMSPSLRKNAICRYAGASASRSCGGAAAAQGRPVRLCKLRKFHNKRLALSRAAHRDDLRAAALFSDTFYNYAWYVTSLQRNPIQKVSWSLETCNFKDSLKAELLLDLTGLVILMSHFIMLHCKWVH